MDERSLDEQKLSLMTEEEVAEMNRTRGEMFGGEDGLSERRVSGGEVQDEYLGSEMDVSVARQFEARRAEIASAETDSDSSVESVHNNDEDDSKDEDEDDDDDDDEEDSSDESSDESGEESSGGRSEEGDGDNEEDEV